MFSSVLGSLDGFPQTHLIITLTFTITSISIWFAVSNPIQFIYPLIIWRFFVEEICVCFMFSSVLGSTRKGSSDSLYYNIGLHNYFILKLFWCVPGPIGEFGPHTQFKSFIFLIYLSTYLIRSFHLFFIVLQLYGCNSLSRSIHCYD